MYAHLLDGSRAANRLGWQWTVGTGTGKPYGFSRWQVQKRAPQLCRDCALASACPIQQWPDAHPGRVRRRSRPDQRPGPGRSVEASKVPARRAGLAHRGVVGHGTSGPVGRTRAGPPSSCSTSRCCADCFCRASGWCSWPRRSPSSSAEVHRGNPRTELAGRPAGDHLDLRAGMDRRAAQRSTSPRFTHGPGYDGRAPARCAPTARGSAEGQPLRCPARASDVRMRPSRALRRRDVLL